MYFFVLLQTNFVLLDAVGTRHNGTVAHVRQLFGKLVKRGVGTVELHAIRAHQLKVFGKLLVGFVHVCVQFRLHGRKIHGFFDDFGVIRDVLHIDGFVKVSVHVSSAPPTQLFGGNGHPTAAQHIVHCFALRDCSGVFTPLFGGGRGGGGGGGRGGGGGGGGGQTAFQSLAQ